MGVVVEVFFSCGCSWRGHFLLWVLARFASCLQWRWFGERHIHCKAFTVILIVFVRWLAREAKLEKISMATNGKDMFAPTNLSWYCEIESNNSIFTRICFRFTYGIVLTLLLFEIKSSLEIQRGSAYFLASSKPWSCKIATCIFTAYEAAYSGL